MAALSSLFVELRVSTKEWSKDIAGALADLKAFDRQTRALTTTIDSIGRGFTSAGKTLTVGLTAPIVAMGAVSVANFNESAKAVALMENAIRSTGGAAGKTSGDLQKMASELQKNSIFGDEDILTKVSTQLLTFTNVAGTAFDRGTQAALNMSTVLGQDLQSSAIQVGKALNDPVAGVTALQRVGVKLSDDQKKLVKSFMDVNDVAGAQDVILKELEKEFGGAAKAAGEAGSGPMIQLKNRINDLSESWGKLLQEKMKPFILGANDVVGRLEKMSDSTKLAVIGFAGVAASIGPVLLGLGQASFAISNIVTLIPRIQAVAGAVGAIGASLAILQGARTYADISAGISLIGEASIAAKLGMVGLTFAIGIGVGSLINWMIEGTRLRDMIDSLVGRFAKWADLWGTQKEAGELAAFTNKAIAGGIGEVIKKQVEVAAAGEKANKVAQQSKEALEKAEAAAKAFRSAVDGMKESIIPTSNDVRTLNQALIELGNQGVPLESMIAGLGDKAVKMVLQLKDLGMNVPPMIQAIAEATLGPQMKAILDKNSADLKAKLDKDHDAWVASFMDAQSIMHNALVSSSERMLKTEEERSKAAIDGIKYETDAFTDGLDAKIGGNEKEISSLERVGVTLTKLTEDNRRRSTEFSQAWNSAIGNVTSGLAKGLTDAVFHTKNFKDSMIGLAKQTAEGMMQAFLSGLFSPLTTALGKIGKSLGDAIFGGGGGKSGGGGGIFEGIIGKALGGGKNGGLLGKLPGVGGIFGGGTAAAGTILGSTATPIATAAAGALGAGGGVAGGAPAFFAGLSPGGGAAGGGASSAIGGLLTNPWTAVVAAGIIGVSAWIKSQAHHEAKALTDAVENPFWRSWGEILPSDKPDVLAKLPATQAMSIGVNLKALNDNYLRLVAQYQTKGKDEKLVGDQSMANTQPHYREVIAGLRTAVVAGGKIPSFQTGVESFMPPSGADSGLALLHRGERVVPAEQNTRIGILAKLQGVYASKASGSEGGLLMGLLGKLLRSGSVPAPSFASGAGEAQAPKSGGGFFSKLAGGIGAILPGAVGAFGPGGGIYTPLGPKAELGDGAPMTAATLLGSLRLALTGHGKIPSYDLGTEFVRQTGLALVHEGERIVPAAQNARGESSNSSSPIFNDYSIKNFNLYTTEPIDERFVRDKMMPWITKSLQTGGGGFREQWTLMFNQYRGVSATKVSVTI